MLLGAHTSPRCRVSTPSTSVIVQLRRASAGLWRCCDLPESAPTLALVTSTNSVRCLSKRPLKPQKNSAPKAIALKRWKALGGCPCIVRNSTTARETTIDSRLQCSVCADSQLFPIINTVDALYQCREGSRPFASIIDHRQLTGGGFGIASRCQAQLQEYRLTNAAGIFASQLATTVLESDLRTWNTRDCEM